MHKREFDRNVWQEQTFKVGHYVFVDRCQKAACASDAAYRMTSHRYNNLLQRGSGPYKLLSFQVHTLVMEKTAYQTLFA